MDVKKTTTCRTQIDFALLIAKIIIITIIIKRHYFSNKCFFCVTLTGFKTLPRCGKKER